MTDEQWYAMLTNAYEVEAAKLEADGWQRRNRGEHFIEHFVKGERKVQLSRRLGDTHWYSTEYFGS